MRVRCGTGRPVTFLTGDEMIGMTSFWIAVYITMLAAFTGYVVISRVPVILHTPLMSGSNFIHGIVLVARDLMIYIFFRRR
jgi:NAD/NADP transhydrogenase alpha subunit